MERCRSFAFGDRFGPTFERIISNNVKSTLLVEQMGVEHLDIDLVQW